MLDNFKQEMELIKYQLVLSSFEIGIIPEDDHIRVFYLTHKLDDFIIYIGLVVVDFVFVLVFVIHEFYDGFVKRAFQFLEFDLEMG
jgi:hypothetical protein